MTDTPRKTLFFLHVPKCAGMSLTYALERHLGADRVYQSTSMIRNHWENRPEFVHVPNPARLQAVTGHWVHETMLPFLAGRLIFATSLRDPVARVRSQYRFDFGMRGAAWRAPDADEFLRRNRDVICNFLCFAFPSIAADYDTRLGGAKAILTGMDRVFDIGDADGAQVALLGELGVEVAEVPRVNESSDVEVELEASDAEIAQTCAADIELYDWFTQARAAAPGAQNPVKDSDMRARMARLRQAEPDLKTLAQSQARRVAPELVNGGVKQGHLMRAIRLQRLYLEALERQAGRHYDAKG